MTLTVNIATRGRPDLLVKTLEHTMPCVSRKDTVVMISVDEDDKDTLGALNRLPTDDRIHVSVKPREDSRGEKYGRALKEHPASVYLPTVDCAPLITPAWDQIILDAANVFPDGIGCVYTPMSNHHFPGLQAPTAKLVDYLGHIYNPEYPFWFVDHEMDDICRMIGRYVFVDIAFPNGEWRPSTTIRMRHLKFWVHYFHLLTEERTRRAWSIIDSSEFLGSKSYKALLKNQSIVVAARSAGINTNVLENAALIEEQRGDKNPVEDDPGYLRALKRAQDKLKAMADNHELDHMAPNGLPPELFGAT